MAKKKKREREREVCVCGGGGDGRGRRGLGEGGMEKKGREGVGVVFPHFVYVSVACRRSLSPA